jgi:hypothetical protein
MSIILLKLYLDIKVLPPRAMHLDQIRREQCSALNRPPALGACPSILFSAKAGQNKIEDMHHLSKLFINTRWLIEGNRYN